MNKATALALLIVGIVLIIFGIDASESIGSEVSRFFTGTPTDKSMWLLLGGIAATTVGAVFSLRSARKL
jgi:divalent metal cation (Fe/Co/Zn/Cd) transporter